MKKTKKQRERKRRANRYTNTHTHTKKKRTKRNEERPMNVGKWEANRKEKPPKAQPLAVGVGPFARFFLIGDGVVPGERRRHRPTTSTSATTTTTDSLVDLTEFFSFFLLISLVPSFSPVKSGDWNEFFFSIFCARPAHRRRRRGGGGGGGGGSSFFFLSTHRALCHQIRFLMDPFYGSPLFFVSLTFFFIELLSN